MTDNVKEIREYVQHLVGIHAGRNAQNNEFEKIFLMNWDEEAKMKRKHESIKITKSPDARNALLGAIRLMIAADPQISVPYDQQEADTELSTQSEKMEKFAQNMWMAAGRIRGDPIHYDLVRSALLFAEYHIGVTSTEDLLNIAKAGGNKVMINRFEAINARTPYLFDTWPVNDGYPEMGPFGLTAFARQYSLKNYQLVAQFGEDAKRLLTVEGDYKPYSTTQVTDFWDLENRAILLQGRDEPLRLETHGLPEIPIVVQLIEGGSLHQADEKYKRQAFLYTIYKSGIWQRQNMMLTVVFSALEAVGLSPAFIFKRTQGGGDPIVNWSKFPAFIDIPAGSEWAPLDTKGVFTQEIKALQELADSKAQESTIYAQTLGEPLGKNAPFSMVALLNQTGRLPLTVPQRKGGWGIADAVRIALMWMKNENKSGVARYQGQAVELEASDIPDQFEVGATLDVALPQDDLQNANIANGLKELASQDYIREKVLKIEQPGQMQEDIWTEQAANMFFTLYLKDQIPLMMGQGQPGQQPGQAVPQQQQGPPMQGQGQISPDMKMQGLPPEMAMGGNQGPEPLPGQPGGEGMVPNA